MSTIEELEHYKCLWQNVREKLEIASKLDAPKIDKPDLYGHPSRLIFGASTHGYKCNEMRESEIQAYEAQLGVAFPINFRMYMSICGVNSGGPGYGINSQRFLVNKESINQDFPLQSGLGVGYLADESDFEFSAKEYSFRQEDVVKGTIDIGTSGNPTSHHLVVCGESKGDVFSYTGDMLFYNGDRFEDWYQKWLYETLSILQAEKGKEG